MTLRRIILGLILLTVAVFCLVAARKLTTTPKYDRIQVGHAIDLSFTIGGGAFANPAGAAVNFHEDTDEGRITIDACSAGPDKPFLVTRKHITPRGPLERLAWLAGWRPRPTPFTVPLPVLPPPPAMPAPPASK